MGLSKTLSYFKELDLTRCNPGLNEVGQHQLPVSLKPVALFHTCVFTQLSIDLRQIEKHALMCNFPFLPWFTTHLSVIEYDVIWLGGISWSCSGGTFWISDHWPSLSTHRFSQDGVRTVGAHQKQKKLPNVFKIEQKMMIKQPTFINYLILKSHKGIRSTLHRIFHILRRWNLKIK